MDAFRYLDRGKSYQDSIKPANFVLAAHVARFGHPDGVDPTHFQLFARSEPDPARWLSMLWIDKYSGEVSRQLQGTRIGEDRSSQRTIARSISAR